MCGHKCSQGVENKYSRRCKALETQRYGKLLSRTFFRSVTTILPTKRPPFWGPKTSPFIQSQFDLLVRATWPPFWGLKTDPKTGVVLSANFLKNSASFDCFRGYATGFAYHWVSMISQRREQFFATPCKHVCPHMLLNWGGPLRRDRFLLWFLDPKLVPTKITVFPFREGARSWENQ